jgi:ABC-type bacteriocin/lantibiotic exporter with double-glycine peptidase domain
VSRRAWLAPEIVQTFAMDCGPAALTSLLRGHGLRVHFDALRARCQTGVDGTSIDELERVADSLGLEVEQIVVPVDYALDSRSPCLPALAVTADPSGALHFVVLWSRLGPFFQVMDPRRGRYLARASELREQLLLHELEVEREDFEAFARAPHFRWFLARRARSVGLHTLRDADPADVDGALRFAAELSGVLGARATSEVIQALIAEPEHIPEELRFATPAEGSAVRLKGAVLLRAVGRKALPSPAPADDELGELFSQEVPAWRGLRGLLSPAAALPAALAVLLAAGLTLVEGLLLRGGLDLLHLLGSPTDRLSAVLALALFLLAQALLVVPSHALTLAMGRRLELRLRAAFAAKIPRLARAWLTSRPTSDWADRGHALHAVRVLPQLLRMVLGLVARMGLLVLGIGWLSPPLLPLALLVALLSLGVPLLAHRVQLAGELRAATQAGALARFVLDAMLGAIPIRTHGAERAVRSEHEVLLTDWARSLSAVHGAVALSGFVQVLLGLLLSGLLLVVHTSLGEMTAGTTLLLVYWSLLLPTYGELLAGTLGQLPHPLSVLERLLPALSAPEEGLPLPPPPVEGPAALQLDGVTVALGGREVLSEVSLQVRPGEHLAVVGASGTGKSTLVSALLGLVSARAGQIRLDGQPLQGEVLAGLRRQVAWVEPSVQLWNRSLLANVRYGIEPGQGQPVADCLEQAELGSVVQGLPLGQQTALGEAGGRLSGGEGNRVRLARALGRPAVRLVLLDEAFRGLDRWSRTTLLARTRAHFSQATLLCVTHDLAETETFPRVVVMEGGRIVQDGAPAELRQQEGPYRTLLEKEASVQKSWWDYAGWRRWWVEGGVLREQPGRTGS